MNPENSVSRKQVASPLVRKRIIHLLEDYPSSMVKLKRLEEDKTIQEWSLDYRSKAVDGGLRGQKENFIGSLAMAESSRTYVSPVEARLNQEKMSILKQLEELRVSIQLTKLLLLSLSEEDRKLIKYRYFDHMPVRMCANRLYFSRSTFYRRQDAVLNELCRHYEDLFPERVQWMEDRERQ